MIEEYFKRLKHKNYIPVIILINTIPYFFPHAWIEEAYTIGSSLQYGSKKDDPFIVLPTERSISLKITIPMDQIFHKTYYIIAKQVIRATTLLCITTKSYRKNDEIKGSQKIGIFDAMSYKFPIKKGGQEGFTLTDNHIEKQAEKEKVSHLEKALQFQENVENSVMPKSDGKKKIAFSDISLPSWIPISCGYFGCSIQSLGCLLTSFHIKTEEGKSQETWHLTFVEYEYRHHTEENQTPPEEIKEKKLDDSNQYSIKARKHIDKDADDVKNRVEIKKKSIDNLIEKTKKTDPTFLEAEKLGQFLEKDMTNNDSFSIPTDLYNSIKKAG